MKHTLVRSRIRPWPVLAIVACVVLIGAVAAILVRTRGIQADVESRVAAVRSAPPDEMHEHLGTQAEALAADVREGRAGAAAVLEALAEMPASSQPEGPALAHRTLLELSGRTAILGPVEQVAAEHRRAAASLARQSVGLHPEDDPHLGLLTTVLCVRRDGDYSFEDAAAQGASSQDPDEPPRAMSLADVTAALAISRMGDAGRHADVLNALIEFQCDVVGDAHAAFCRRTWDELGLPGRLRLLAGHRWTVGERVHWTNTHAWRDTAWRREAALAVRAGLQVPHLAESAWYNGVMGCGQYDEWSALLMDDVVRGVTEIMGWHAPERILSAYGGLTNFSSPRAEDAMLARAQGGGPTGRFAASILLVRPRPGPPPADVLEAAFAAVSESDDVWGHALRSALRRSAPDETARRLGAPAAVPAPTVQEVLHDMAVVVGDGPLRSRAEARTIRRELHDALFSGDDDVAAEAARQFVAAAVDAEQRGLRAYAIDWAEYRVGRAPGEDLILEALRHGHVDLLSSDDHHSTHLMPGPALAAAADGFAIALPASGAWHLWPAEELDSMRRAARGLPILVYRALRRGDEVPDALVQAVERLAGGPQDVPASRAALHDEAVAPATACLVLLGRRSESDVSDEVRGILEDLRTDGTINREVCPAPDPRVSELLATWTGRPVIAGETPAAALARLPVDGDVLFSHERRARLARACAGEADVPAPLLEMLREACESRVAPWRLDHWRLVAGDDGVADRVVRMALDGRPVNAVERQLAALALLATGHDRAPEALRAVERDMPELSCIWGYMPFDPWPGRRRTHAGTPEAALDAFLETWRRRGRRLRFDGTWFHLPPADPARGYTDLVKPD